MFQKKEFIHDHGSGGPACLSGIRKVISDLRRGGDIVGAVLVDESDAVLACDISEHNEYRFEVPRIIDFLRKFSINRARTRENNLFSQDIIDYNGFKVLVKRLRNNLTLFIMMKRMGHIGPAMLDIENSAREIMRIMVSERMAG